MIRCLSVQLRATVSCLSSGEIPGDVWFCSTLIKYPAAWLELAAPLGTTQHWLLSPLTLRGTQSSVSLSPFPCCRFQLSQEVLEPEVWLMMSLCWNGREETEMWTVHTTTVSLDQCTPCDHDHVITVLKPKLGKYTVLCLKRLHSY